MKGFRNFSGGCVARSMGIFMAGALGALVFPPFVNCWAGYAALVGFVLFLFFREREKKDLFWTAYWFGFGFYAVGFSWINNAFLLDDGLFRAFIPVVFLAMGAFFGLFWGIPALISGMFSKNVCGRMLVFCVAFVVMEWVRSFLFTGFPWNLLGTALSFDVRLLQGAAYIGTYGLSLMLMMFVCGLALCVLSVYKRRFIWKSLFFVLIPPVFIAVAGARFEKVQSDSNGLVVRLVQPNIPQTLKWNPAMAAENFQKYINMSRSGEEFGKANLVVWGETACPYPLDEESAALAEIRQAIPQNGFLITGLLRLGGKHGEQAVYNSMFVINHNGEVKDYYDKSHLVPFGEYLPFREYWPDFMRPVANVVGDLGRGEKYKNIRVSGLPLMGGAICYESIFPKEVINPQEKPEVLAVLANDGWYGMSVGPYQHLAAVQMRAVEEGITIIRGANTGISAVIAPNGEILGEIGLGVEGVLDIRLPKVLSKTTFYGKYGNLVVLGGMLLVLLLIAMGNIVFTSFKKN